MAAGRPTTYTEKIASEILERIASGESVRSIARDDRMPAQSTIFKWSFDNPEFSVQYEKAKAVAAESLAEEMEEIARQEEDTTRAKLIIDTRKWNLSKQIPKRFGDRIHQELTGKDGGPVQIENLSELSDAELAKIAAASEGGTSQA